MRVANILDVNDYCLQEIFKYLDLSDLCAAADVCDRFRNNAQAYFKLSKYTNLIEHREVTTNVTSNEKFLQISNVLRIFGAFIKSIYLRGASHYQDQIFELLTQYCSGTLGEMELEFCDITDEIALPMRPVLEGLQKLTSRNCYLGELFCKMLPDWSPELRQLEFNKTLIKNARECAQFDGMLQSYGNLVQMKFFDVNDLTKNFVKALLKRNPQLKKIEIVMCRGIEGCIIESIATHTPQIEALEYDAYEEYHISDVPYFGQLNNLNTLVLSSTHLSFGTRLMLILNYIIAANAPLKCLELSGFDVTNKAVQFVDAMSKLRNLKKLKFSHAARLDAQHIRDICKNLPELCELNLYKNELTFDETDLLELIHEAKNLRELHFMSDGYDFLYGFGYMNIDVDIFMKMVEIVQQRREKIHLLAHLDPRTFNANIPKELIERYKDVLTLVAY